MDLKVEDVKVAPIEYRKYLNTGEQYMIKLPVDTLGKLGSSTLEKIGFNISEERGLPEPNVDIVVQTYSLDFFMKVVDLLKKIQKADHAFTADNVSIGVGKDQPLKVEIKTDEYDEKERKTLTFWVAPKVG